MKRAQLIGAVALVALSGTVVGIAGLAQAQYTAPGAGMGLGQGPTTPSQTTSTDTTTVAPSTPSTTTNTTPAPSVPTPTILDVTPTGVTSTPTTTNLFPTAPTSTVPLAPVPQPSVTTTPTNTPSTAPAFPPLPLNPPAPIVVNVAADGSVLIRGIVQNISTSSITLLSWGGLWTIQTTPGTSLVTNGGITVGDEVGVIGTAVSSAQMTIDASLVRDWTNAPL